MRVRILMNDAEIIAAVQSGDTDKFGLLYDTYFPRIFAYLFYRTRNRATAEDLVSTTFLKAVKGIGKFDGQKGTFSAWLYRIARNTLYDHGRRWTTTVPLEYAEAVSAKDDIEKEVADRKTVAEVQAMLSELPSMQREVVSMRAWDGLSYAEIAGILGKSEGSCKMAFHRAATKFRASFQ